MAVSAVFLSSCGGDRESFFAQAFGYQCSNHDSATARKMCGRSNEASAAQVSRYCYRSLGGPNCFDQPDPGKTQSLGSSGY